MLRMPLGMMRTSRLKQPENVPKPEVAPFGISVTSGGTSSDLSPDAPVNTPDPSDARANVASFDPASNVIVLSFLQPSKARKPIELTFAGTTTDSSAVVPEKAFRPTDVSAEPVPKLRLFRAGSDAKPHEPILVSAELLPKLKCTRELQPLNVFVMPLKPTRLLSCPYVSLLTDRPSGIAVTDAGSSSDVSADRP